MKWLSKIGTVDLTSVTVRGGLPTLGVGTYDGIFVGAAVDAGGHQWITVATPKGGHVEQSDLDVSAIAPTANIKFTIAVRGGAVAVMQGNQYKLVTDGKDITDWMNMSELYKHIQDNNITLAEPKLVNIEIR